MVNVHEIWVRKDAPDDDEWARVEVVGVQALTAELPDEYVLRKVDGLATVQTSEENLRAAFDLESPGSAPPIPPGAFQPFTELGEGFC
jgi:hypothetical protein